MCCIITQAGFMIIRGLVQMQRLRFIDGETGDLLKRFLCPPTSESQPSTHETAAVTPLNHYNPYVAASSSSNLASSRESCWMNQWEEHRLTAAKYKRWYHPTLNIGTDTGFHTGIISHTDILHEQTTKS